MILLMICFIIIIFTYVHSIIQHIRRINSEPKIMIFSMKKTSFVSFSLSMKISNFAYQTKVLNTREPKSTFFKYFQLR